MKKAFIASFLLFAYALSFAHNAIPHCHHTFGANEGSHGHMMEHSHHGPDYHAQQPADHTHITHKDHLDHGFLDLLICLLSETEHPDSDEGERYFSETNKVQKKDDLSRVKLAMAVLAGLFMDSENEGSPIAARPELRSSYAAPPLALAPHRGPPQISC